MQLRFFLIAIVSFSLSVAACGSGDPAPGGTDAAANATDADPNAPDADPNAPDANANATDAATNTPDADPNAPDATPGGGPDAALGVACGTATCTLGTQECCVSGGIGGSTQTCVTAGTCQDNVLSCDGPEDCNGTDVCCGTGSFGGGGGGGGVSTTCAADCTGGQSAVLCRVDTDCPSAEPKCCSSFIYTSDVCQANCFGG